MWDGDEDAVQSEVIVIGKQLLHGLVPRGAAVLGTQLGHGHAHPGDAPSNARLGGDSIVLIYVSLTMGAQDFKIFNLSL